MSNRIMWNLTVFLISLSLGLHLLDNTVNGVSYSKNQFNFFSNGRLNLVRNRNFPRGDAAGLIHHRIHIDARTHISPSSHSVIGAHKSHSITRSVSLTLISRSPFAATEKNSLIDISACAHDQHDSLLHIICVCLLFSISIHKFHTQ